MWISEYGIALDTATRDGQRNAVDLLLTSTDKIENDLTDLPAEIVQKIGNTYRERPPMHAGDGLQYGRRIFRSRHA